MFTITGAIEPALSKNSWARSETFGQQVLLPHTPQLPSTAPSISLLFMANFKRKGPKSTRAGCLLCKPQKRQGQRLALRVTFAERRRLEAAKFQVAQSQDAPSIGR